MKKGCLIPLIVLIVIVLGAGAYVVYYLYQEEQQDPVVYQTAAPYTGSIVNKSVATGSVTPRTEVEIKPNISGIISELLVEAGDTVRTGDLIARVKVIPDMVSLNNAENRVNRAQIAVENAQQDYDRNQALLEQGVISPADFLPVETARRNAQEELNAAQENLAIVREGASKRAGKASLTNVRSTIDGMILDVPIKEGNSVIEANNFNDGTTIASVADMRDLIFLGKVDESEVEKLETGMDLIVSVGAIEGRTFPAGLEYISPKGIEENGAIQFEIKAALRLETGEFIRAGYSANADVVLDRRDSVLVISEGLIQFDDARQPFVEVKVGEGQWERRDVELGLSDGMQVEVLGGVAEGDSIKQWNQAGRPWR